MIIYITGIHPDALSYATDKVGGEQPQKHTVEETKPFNFFLPPSVSYFQDLGEATLKIHLKFLQDLAFFFSTAPQAACHRTAELEKLVSKSCSRMPVVFQDCLTHVCSLDWSVNEMKNGVLWRHIFLLCFSCPLALPRAPHTNNRSPQHCSGPASSRVTEETVCLLMLLANNCFMLCLHKQNSFGNMFSLLKAPRMLFEPCCGVSPNTHLFQCVWL